MDFEKWWSDPKHGYAKDFPSDKWLAEESWKASREAIEAEKPNV